MALGGVKVLDLTRMHAGPFASMILGDLGATVLKIEPPSGDETRRLTLFSYGPMSAFFVPSNRNKRSLALDLNAPNDRERFDDLLQDADVLMDNFRPSTLQRMGLDYQSVVKKNPDIISVSVTGYGEGSPDADNPAYDLLVQAQSGIMSLTGEPDSNPVKVGVPIGDLLAGVYAALGTVAALYQRRITGKGQRIEVAMLDSQIAVLCYHYTYYDASGSILPRIGSAHHNMVPYGLFRCSDGFLALAVVPEPIKFWHSTCEAIGRPEWITDERFATGPARVANREELDQRLEEIFHKHPRSYWVQKLKEAGVPVASVNEIRDLADDEQVQSRNMIVELASPAYGRVHVPGNPSRWPEPAQRASGYRRLSLETARTMKLCARSGRRARNRQTHRMGLYR